MEESGISGNDCISVLAATTTTTKNMSPSDEIVFLIDLN